MQKIIFLSIILLLLLSLVTLIFPWKSPEAADCDPLLSSLSGERDLATRRSLLKSGVESCPESIQVRYSYALELERSRHYQDALKQYEIVLQLDPTMAAAYFNSGDIYRSQGQYEKAIESYSSGLNLDPKNKRARKRMTECKDTLKQQSQN